FEITAATPRRPRMDKDELRRFAKRFRDRHFTAGPQQKPKLGLPVLNAARHYRAVFGAAERARRDLAAAVAARHPDPTTALAALNHLADTFNLPPFTRDDLAPHGG